MKIMTKLNKGVNKCLCCHHTSNTSWYQWKDIYINPGKIIHERVCLKCAKSILGKKHLDQLN